MNHRRAIFSKTANMNILHPRKFSCLLRFTLYQNVEETFILVLFAPVENTTVIGSSVTVPSIPKHPLYLDTSMSKEHINHSSFAQSGLLPPPSKSLKINWGKG